MIALGLGITVLLCSCVVGMWAAAAQIPNWKLLNRAGEAVEPYALIGAGLGLTLAAGGVVWISTNAILKVLA